MLTARCLLWNGSAGSEISLNVWLLSWSIFFSTFDWAGNKWCHFKFGKERSFPFYKWSVQVSFQARSRRSRVCRSFYGSEKKNSFFRMRASSSHLILLLFFLNFTKNISPTDFLYFGILLGMNVRFKCRTKPWWHVLHFKTFFAQYKKPSCL